MSVSLSLCIPKLALWKGEVKQAGVGWAHPDANEFICRTDPCFACREHHLLLVQQHVSGYSEGITIQCFFQEICHADL